MDKLNDIEYIKKIDPANTHDSTFGLIKQCKHAFNEAFDAQYSELGGIENIVFCGMGASIYSGIVIKSLYKDELNKPIEIVSDYCIPSYVSDKSLIILTSYSGTTEEVISCANQAIKKTKNIIVVTKGGFLADFAMENNLNSYVFDAKLNPAGVPRLGNGYTILSLIAIFIKLGLLKISSAQINQSLDKFININNEISNTAKKYANELQNYIPVIITSEHLQGNAHIMRNQFNETSKSFADYFMVPDLNHHLMEGLAFPKDQKLYFLLFQSNNYTEKNNIRVTLTEDVIKQNNHKTELIKLNNESKFEDFINMLLIGSFTTFYLGILNEQNPAINPFVDYFKDKLK